MAEEQPQEETWEEGAAEGEWAEEGGEEGWQEGAEEEAAEGDHDADAAWYAELAAMSEEDLNKHAKEQGWSDEEFTQIKQQMAEYQQWAAGGEWAEGEGEDWAEGEENGHGTKRAAEGAAEGEPPAKVAA
eukprot:TRINITY_DN17081_c0_g1_i1.p3 TRINITY_DN17081_c0_g1~~TRINITY_DN17081_c0_g1_i1.p3  ORF type:complete len:130 (+),score=60.58 TRINITY_DN17081_c0_g1_i1:71-460(+)